MAETVDPELRAAILAFFRDGWGDKVRVSEAAFTEFIDKTIIENQGHLQEAFLLARDRLGRFPTFEELRQAGMWSVTGERPAGE